jgi:hypothetical protein
MAGFMQELWESIFSPGPTPTLLKATNGTFACLQILLLILLVVTYNIHFVILSVLSGGLWWAINWFAAELKIHQEREERETRAQQTHDAQGGTEDSETEVETTTAVGSRTKEVSGSSEVEPVEQIGELKHRVESTPGTQSSASTEDEWEKVSENEKDKDK